MFSSHPLVVRWGTWPDFLKKDFPSEFIDPHNHPLRTIDLMAMYICIILLDRQTLPLPLFIRAHPVYSHCNWRFPNLKKHSKSINLGGQSILMLKIDIFNYTCFLLMKQDVLVACLFWFLVCQQVNLPLHLQHCLAFWAFVVARLPFCYL